MQLCNEAVHGAGALGMYDWYESVVAAVGRINVELPVYISDAWDLTSALRWSNSVNTPGRIAAPVVVDTHRYYCFAEQDKRLTPREAIEKVNGELGETGEYTGNVFDGKCAGVVVGEWSCVLDGATWGRVEAGERDGLVQEFGRAQGRRWREMCGGACFWTAKMEWMDGGEWGFVAQTKTQALLPPEGRTLANDEMKRRLGAAEETRQKLEKTALDAHAEYWETQSPGLFARPTAEAGWDTVHEGYVTGWRLGWADARAFLEGVDTGGGDRIGLLDLWVLKRMRESRRWKASDEKGWEWEQGFRKGVHDFEETTGLQRA